jgi:hypothetical protein
MGGPRPPCNCHKDALVAQNRAEALLLELISERLLKHKPPAKEEVEADDKRMTGLGYPPSEIELAHRKGYETGWWECYEVLSNLIDAHNDENDYRRQR